MSRDPGAAARTVTVLARDPAGDVVARVPLGHGVDPARALAARGWSVRRATRARVGGERRDELTVEVEVASVRDAGGPAEGRPGPDGPRTAGRTGHAGAVAREDPEGTGEVPRVVQRVAAYAVLTSERGMLLTELSTRVRGTPGRWTLPGGGLDPGEEPADGLVREVWEETGHDVVDVELADLTTAHWVGRSPSGRLEDFHAVRLVHHARVARVVEPVVHDVGGSTSRAAWVPLERVASLELAPLLRPHWRRWVASAPA